MSLISNEKQLREFLLFCKENKVKSVSLGNISFELSEIAFIDQDNTQQQLLKEIENYTSKTIIDDLDPVSENSAAKEDDEDLYWSTNT